MSTREERFNLKFFKRFLKLLPWLFPGFKSKPACLFLLILCLCLLEQYIIYNIGLVPSKFYKILGDKDQDGFWKHTAVAVGLIVAEAFIKSSITYISNLMGLVWRDSVTRQLHRKYFTDLLYYSINVLDKTVDNPDQRITQDVDKLSEQLSQILAPLIISPFTIAYYLYKAEQGSGYIGPVGTLIFFAIATVMNKLLMSPVVKFVFKRERMEGNFRFKHMSIRSNSESAAFYRAGKIELEKTNSQLANLINTQDSLIRRQFALNFSVNMFDYLGSILSYIALAFPIFLGTYDHLSASELSALISANAFVVIYLISCFTKLIDLSVQVTIVAGTTHRVVQLIEVLDKLRNEQDIRAASRPAEMRGFGWSEMETLIVNGNGSNTTTSTTPDSNGGSPVAPISAFHVTNLTYCAPQSKQQMCKELSFKFERGVNILVAGDSGCGKSSLLRVLNGIWPEVRGLVEYNVNLRPGVLLYLPQRPYFTDGSLRQQIVFPCREYDNHYILDSDEVIHNLLDKTDLGHLCGRVNGLDTQMDWNWYDHLSPGEMQRLSFVRLFYHKPAFAVLDEATSQISIDMERRLYTLCAEMGITLLSVGHRDTLRQFHNIELKFTGGGSWTIKPIVNQGVSSVNQGVSMEMVNQGESM